MSALFETRRILRFLAVPAAAIMMTACGFLSSDDQDDADPAGQSTSCVRIESSIELEDVDALDARCYVFEGLITMEGSLAVSSGTTLELDSQSVLTVTGSLTISSGTTLTFGEDAGIDVDGGVLIADAGGDDADPIRFVGSREVAGHWRGLRFANAPGQASRLNNVEVSHAGSRMWDSTRSVSRANIVVAPGGLLHLSDALISDSGHHGVSIIGGQLQGCSDVRFDNIERHSSFADDAEDSCF